jgi:nucleoid-associated protein YgaU
MGRGAAFGKLPARQNKKGAEPMASTIGIKIANGEFYSILDENSNVKKRLVLTTVHDNQRSVQIDLYRSYTKTMADALYIGSLVVEDIRPKLKGWASIEMVVSCDTEGHISAEALDLDTGSGGQHQYLSVSLKSLDDDSRDLELPDFELEQHNGPPQGLYERARAAKDKEKQKQKKTPWILVILLGVLVIVICLALFFFLIRGRDFFKQGTPSGEPARVESAGPPPPVPREAPAPAVPAPVEPVPAPAAPAVPAQSTAPAPRQAPPPVIEAPARPQPAPVVSRKRNPPVASYKVPATIPRNGVAYRIRWGDTLWDIAAAFYRNPWLYPRIARYNGIKNPDLIISGTTIRVPPKN